MALKVGVGGRYSDSFITVDEADAILATLPDDTTAWEALTDTEKEYRLKLAAQMIGYLPLRGKKIYRGQALCFPRSGGLYPPKAIPPEVKEAQAMIAYSVVTRALANRPDPTEAAGSKVSSVSLGGLLSVGFAVGRTGAAGNFLDMISTSVNFPIYVRLKRFLAQLRGWQTPASVTYSLSTTTTETTSSSTTTTTV